MHKKFIVYNLFFFLQIVFLNISMTTRRTNSDLKATCAFRLIPLLQNDFINPTHSPLYHLILGKQHINIAQQVYFPHDRFSRGCSSQLRPRSVIRPPPAPREADCSDYVCIAAHMLFPAVGFRFPLYMSLLVGRIVGDNLN